MTKKSEVEFIDANDEATNAEQGTQEEAVEDQLDEGQEDHDLEEEHVSLSSRILKGLALMLFGAVAALWAGPKIAPMLPSGLKPVADFFAPQTTAETQIATLESALDEKLAALDAKIASQSQTSQLAPAIEELKTSATKSDQSVSALGEQISGIETAVKDLQAELAALNARQIVGAETGATSEKLIKEFEEKLAAISNAQQALSTAQSVAVSAKGDAEHSLRLSRANAALQDINVALRTGVPFETSIKAVSNIQGVTIPQGLSSVAKSGLTPSVKLAEQFPSLARVALREIAASAGGDSAIGKFTSFLKTQVGTRSLEPQTGDTPDAVLSRMEAAIGGGDLTSVLSESAKLPETAQTIFRDWTANVANLKTATDAVTELQNVISANLKSME